MPRPARKLRTGLCSYCGRITLGRLVLLVIDRTGAHSRFVCIRIGCNIRHGQAVKEWRSSRAL